jgi:outer membrane protein
MIALLTFVAVLNGPNAPPSATQAAPSVADAARAAVNASPAVQAAQVHVTEMRGLLDAAQRSAPPQLIASHVDAPQGAPGGTIDQSLTTLGGSYSFADAYARGPAVAQARAEIARAEIDLQDAERLERRKAIDAYFDAARAQADVAARIVLDADARRDLRAAQTRYRAGDAPRLDVVRAQVDVTRAEAALDATRVTQDNALDALSVETGIERTRFTVLSAPDADAPLESGDALLARALARRTDLASARAAVDVQRTAIDAAQRAGKPNVSVSAGYTQGVDAGFFVRGPSASVQVGLPVGGPAPARTAVERDRVREAELKVADVERNVRLEVTSALRAAQAAQRAVRAAVSTAAAANEELRAVRTGYARGASSSLDVSEARRVEAEAEIDAIDARYTAARTRAELAEVSAA